MEGTNPDHIPLEQSIRRLEEIVAELEQGEQELETALKSYEEGIKLARTCLEQLKTAELRIEELSGFDEE